MFLNEGEIRAIEEQVFSDMEEEGEDGEWGGGWDSGAEYVLGLFLKAAKAHKVEEGHD
jgi:hypothetical protein